MSIPSDRLEDFERTERTRGMSNAILSAWIKTPYYAARWNYFHRPSVWGRMSQRGSFDWYGLTGFKSLVAGPDAGIGYNAGTRTAGGSMRWILRTGGRGIELAGEGLMRAGFQPAGTSPRLVRSFVEASGRHIAGFGRGFGTGGIAGGIRGVSGGSQRVIGAAGLLEDVFGGKLTSFPGRPILSGIPGLGGVSDEAIRGLIRKEGVSALFAPWRARERVLGGLPTAQRAALTSYTGKAGQRALTRSIMFQGATRLMQGVTVGLNIALFGGMLGTLAYEGSRVLAEQSFRLMHSNSIPRLEFGTGQLAAGFMTTGAMTERQRAIAAISNSSLNARRYMGNEAAIMSENMY